MGNLNATFFLRHQRCVDVRMCGVDDILNATLYHLIPYQSKSGAPTIMAEGISEGMAMVHRFLFSGV